MCPVLCDPARNPDEADTPPVRRRLARRAVGLLLCVLIAATPLLYQAYPAAVNAVAEGVWSSRPVVVARNVARPATRLANGDVRHVRSWITHQKTSRILLLASLGICMGIYLMLRE